MSEAQKPTTDAYRRNWNEVWGVKPNYVRFCSSFTGDGRIKKPHKKNVGKDEPKTQDQ